MRKLKLLLASVALLFGGGISVWAQTDVTSTYITNPGFESDPAASANVSGYNAPTSWTIQSGGNGGAGVATYGAAYTVNSQQMPASPGVAYGNNGFMFRVAWGGTSYIYQEVTLPAGYYELGFSAQAIFANSKKTILKSATGFYIPSTSKAVYGQVQDLSNTSMSSGYVGIVLTEETALQIRIGYQAQGYGSGNSTSVVFDNITLKKYASEHDALAAASAEHPIDISYKLKGDALTSSTWSYDDGTHTNWQTTKGVTNTGSDYYWGSDNNTGGANYFEAWITGGSKKAGRIFYQSIDNVYAGSYTFRAAAMANTTESGVALYVGDGTTPVNPGDKVGRFYSATGSISNYPLEYGLKQDAATTNWFAIAQTGLFYKGATLEQLKTQLSTLGAILSNSDYDCVTGSERTAVYNIVNNTYVDDKVVYMEAIDDLIAAIATFKAAKPAYVTFDTEKESALAMGVSAGSIVRPVSGSASDLENALHALYVLEDAAANSGYTIDATDMFGSWTTQNLGTASGEHWNGNGSTSYFDKWQNSGFTSSITNTVTLPEGKYVFKVAARAQSGGINGAFNMSVKIGSNDAIYKDFVAKDATGKGIDISGAVNYGDGSFANNNNGYGWEWRFIAFELDEEAEVVMKAYAQIFASHWVGFVNPTLLTTTDNVEICRQMYVAAKDVAEAARDNDYYELVIGTERTNLVDAIDEAVPDPATYSWYQSQKTALENATAEFIAANPAYVALSELNNTIATALGVSTVSAATSSSTAAEIAATLNTQNVNEYNAATTNYTYDATALLGAWSNAPGTNKGESWDGTGDDTYYDEYNASARAMSQTITLPKASYVLIAKGRASVDGKLTMTDGTNTVTFPHKSSTGKGIETDGTPNFGDGTYANSNNGRGWEYRFLTFESDGTTATTLTFNWTTSSSNWAGLDDITLLAIPETETISEDATEAPVYTLANVTLTRTLSASYWNTFSVPFDAEIPTGWEVKKFDSATDNVISFADATSFEAGKPYLVKPTANVVNPTFDGVIVENTSGETEGTGDYKFAAQIYNKALATDGTIAYLATDGSIKKLTSGSIKGLRAYFIIPASGAPARLSFGDDETTGISTMHNAQFIMHNELFDLQGRKVTKPAKGLYIKNGKKVVMK